MNTQEKRGLAAVALIVILMLLPIGAALNNEYQAGRARVELELAEQESAKKEVEAEKAVASMMVNHPQKTGKTGNKKMVKIARGTTGQADLKDLGHENPYCSEGAGGGYWALGPDPLYAIATSNSPNGWSVAGGGTVAVPIEASPGVYRIIYQGESCGDPEEYLWLNYEYEFEVVCFTVTVTATPVS